MNVFNTINDLRDEKKLESFECNNFTRNLFHFQDKIRHVGDLGNIEAGNDGIARVHIVSNQTTVCKEIVSSLFQICFIVSYIFLNLYF